MSTIEHLLNFVTFTHKFNRIKRTVYVIGTDTQESDSEHSYQLALVAWYIITTKQLDLDITTVIKYALAHDLVEIYAGDTYFYNTDPSIKAAKIEKEQEALKRIKKDFAEFPELGEIIKSYEELNTPEARFISALDKVLPVINIILDKGRMFHNYKVTYEIIRTKDEKVKIDKDIERLWKEVVKVMDHNRGSLFPKI